MEDIIRFEPEQDERLKEVVAHADGDAVIKNIYGYLKQYGAVRKDVYEFLVMKSDSLCKTDYNFLIELLRGQAECAWYELFRRIGKEKLSTSLYKREVVDAFRKGLPLYTVVECYEKAATPYDMWFAIQEQMEQPERGEENKKNNEESEVLLLREQLRQAQEELEALRKKYEEKEKKQEENFSAIEDENAEELIVKETIPAPKYPEENEAAAKPEEKKVGKSAEAKKKGMLFQKIRHIRQRAALEKMTEQRKMEELFVLLRRQNYTPKMIRSVRTVIEYGITFEFLYAFVESEATEAELDALVAFKAPTPVTASKEFVSSDMAETQ